MKILRFILLVIILIGCNTSKHNAIKDRKKFIYAVTQPLDEKGFIIKLKIFDSTRGYKYIWHRTGTLYSQANKESRIDSTTFRRMIRNIILKDLAFNTALFGRYRFYDTLGIQPQPNKLKEFENLINNNPKSYMDTLFRNGMWLDEKWFHFWVEAAWVLWDKNIGLRTEMPILGYYKGAYVNDSLLREINKPKYYLPKENQEY